MPNTIKFNTAYPEITNSNELYERALKVQKPVTQTLAKGPGQFTKGVAPKYIQKAKGSHVWDVDGNEYIDFNSAIGPISLGYAYPVVDEAIKNQLADGITFSLMHRRIAVWEISSKQALTSPSMTQVNLACAISPDYSRIREFLGPPGYLSC